jgi:hypothetical protein
MFEELLAESKALAKAGDLKGALAKVRELQDWCNTEEEVVISRTWQQELVQRDNADFMSSLAPRVVPNDLSAAPEAGETVKDMSVNDKTVLSAPATDVVAAPTPVGDSENDSGIAFFAPRAREPVSLIEEEAPPRATPAAAPHGKPPESAAPAVVESPGTPEFRDSRLEAFVAGAPVAPAAAAAAPPATAAKPEAEPAHDRPRTKPQGKGIFRREVIVALAGLGVLTVILEPWKWGHEKKPQAAPADSRYPELSFRESRVDAVTPEATRALFGQKKEPAKAEFTSSLVAAATPPAMSQSGRGTTATPGGSKASGSHVRAAKHVAVPAAPPPQPGQVAPEQTPATAEAAPARRRGSRYYDAPVEDPAAGAAKKPAGIQPAGLPVNTRIRAELQIGISSTKHDAVVLARVLAPVQITDKVLVPKGALLRGRSSNDNDRVYIRFSELIVGKDRFSIGAAVVEGDLPGVHAQKREATLEERQQSRVAQGALGAAADVALSLAGAGVAATALRGVSSGAVQETQQAQQYDTSVVLMVPARTPLEAVVVE